MAKVKIKDDQISTKLTSYQKRQIKPYVSCGVCGVDRAEVD